MENLFFLILVAIVGLIRWITQMAENKKNAEAAKRAGQEQPDAPLQRAPARTEEERIRRFMEALGVPTTSAPPPKTERRQVIAKKPPEPKRKILPVNPFPTPRFDVPKPTVSTAPSPIIVSVPASTPEPPPLPTRETTVLIEPSPRRVEPTQRLPAEFEVHEINLPTEEAIQETSSGTVGPAVSQRIISAEADWGRRLATSEGLRDAIILREIFGPPRSMRPLEERAIA